MLRKEHRRIEARNRRASVPGVRRGRQKAIELATLERRQYVFRLRITGASFGRISQLMHQDPAWAARLPKTYRDAEVWRDVMTEIKRRRDSMSIDVEAIRQQELELLDQMQLAIIQRALGTPANPRTGEPAQPADLEAQRQLLGIMERRARYLPGLNAPTPVAPVTPDGTASYDPGQASAAFFAELSVLVQQLGPQHLLGDDDSIIDIMAVQSDSLNPTFPETLQLPEKNPQAVTTE